MSDGRRYFNLYGVVRDLEHAAGADSTAEGRDLLDRFRDIVVEAAEVAAALDADDGTSDEDIANDELDDDVGHEGQAGGGQNGSRPRIDDASSESLHARLARVESALANQPGPASPVPSGSPGVGRAGRRTTLLTQEAPKALKGGKRGVQETAKPKRRRKTTR